MNACYRTFVSQAERLVYCHDDAGARSLGSVFSGSHSYGFDDGAYLRALDVEMKEAASEFSVVRDGKPLGRVRLPVPGRHNLLNALASILVSLELGLEFEAVATGITELVLPRRRLEVVVERDGYRVMSDYAHHPTEITAVLKAVALEPNKRVLVVYQPHRYSRTKALGPMFPAAFEGIDELVLVPVYAASEDPCEGGSVWDLYA